MKEVDISGRKVMVAIPCGDGKIDARLATILLKAMDLLHSHGARMSFAHISHCSLVTRARDQLAADFLKNEEMTDFFMIDSDVVPTMAAWIVQLVARATEHPVVAGAYPSKIYGDPPVASYRVDYESGELTVEDDLIPIARIGAGFMNVRREVMTKLASGASIYRRHPDEETFFWRLFNEKTEYVNASEIAYIGEDYSFCDRVREAGYRIMLDPAIELLHVKTQDLHGKFGVHAIEKGLMPAPPET
jgi:hypothetical protein